MFPFLDELTNDGRQRLLAAAQVINFAAHTRVINKGDDVGGVYLVESGALRIFYISPEGREGTLYWVDARQTCILALNCLFSKLAYPAWVETESEETQITVISGNAYRELFIVEPGVQRFTFETLSTRIFDLMTLMQETASLGLEQRVASFLLRRSVGRSALEVTHEQIANHVGSSREVVSRVLRNLARHGAISLSQRSISIDSRDKLTEFVEF